MTDQTNRNGDAAGHENDAEMTRTVDVASRLDRPDLAELRVPGEAGEDIPALEPSAEAELAESKDRLLRTLADMENLRRRTQRELDEARKYAVTGFARGLLEVADNLARALSSVPPDLRERDEFLQNLVTGVEMTERTLLGLFEKHEIRKVQPRKGEKFDHNLHQAMFELPTDEVPAGSIAEVLQPGYVIADRLLRPAMVGVAKPAAEPGREAFEGAPALDTQV